MAGPRQAGRLSRSSSRVCARGPALESARSA